MIASGYPKKNRMLMAEANWDLSGTGCLRLASGDSAPFRLRDVVYELSDSENKFWRETRMPIEDTCTKDVALLQI